MAYKNDNDNYFEEVIGSRLFDYTFKVRRDKTGRPYLLIGEIRKKTNARPVYKTVLVYEGDEEEFLKGLLRAVKYMRQTDFEKKVPLEKNKKITTHSLDEIRKIHANAYKPWSQKEDDRLVELHDSGNTLKTICQLMGRNKGSIRSRLKRLGFSK